MISTKKKIFAILVMMLLLLLIAAGEMFNRSKNVVSPNIESAIELTNQSLGGVASKMPENSTKILFEGILGLKLKNYQAYASIEETLYALRVNEIQAAWFSDVTAAYLLKTEEGIREIPSIDIVSGERLEFSLALRTEDTKLRDNINLALSTLKENGKLTEITGQYIDWNEEPEPFYEDDMVIRQKGYSYSDTIYVGITGATPPIDMLNEQNKPYGFCVALMDEIAQMNAVNVKFVAIKNEAAFSSLQGGKIDVLFCYGTSPSTMDPDNVDEKRAYLMTEGYYGMNQYSFLCLE